MRATIHGAYRAAWPSIIFLDYISKLQFFLILSKPQRPTRKKFSVYQGSIKNTQWANEIVGRAYHWATTHSVISLWNTWIPMKCYFSCWSLWIFFTLVWYQPESRTNIMSADLISVFLQDRFKLNIPFNRGVKGIAQSDLEIPSPKTALCSQALACIRFHFTVIIYQYDLDRSELQLEIIFLSARINFMIISKRVVWFMAAM